MPFRNAHEHASLHSPLRATYHEYKEKIFKDECLLDLYRDTVQTISCSTLSFIPAVRACGPGDDARVEWCAYE